MNASDTQNFDDTFLDMEPILDDPNEHEQTDTDQDRDQTDAEPTDGEDAYPTPSHSRSPSVHPNGDHAVDVFDGYSFKGRYSVLVDEEPEDSGDSGEEGTDEDDLPSVVTDTVDISSERVDEVLESPVGLDEQTPEPEPKTPEARPLPLPVEPQPTVIPLEPKPILSLEPVLAMESLATPRTSNDIPTYIVPASPKEACPPLPAKDGKPKTTRIAVPPSGRTTRGRREKSGVPALDRFLSNGGEEDGESTEKDDEDDDWAFIEAGDGEDRNGTKGNSLFARGVVDRYRLAVFRKASTPSQRTTGRSFSGLSKESDIHTGDPGNSPSPPDKQRRGRAPGLKFRKTPKQFLRGKSPPPSSYPSKNGNASKGAAQSSTNTATVSSMSSTGLLTPSASTMPIPPSLKSKESAVSVGEQSASSDQSNGETPSGQPGSPEASKIIASPTQSPSAHAEEPEKLKSKKLKKYKENAEKVLSLFASPR